MRHNLWQLGCGPASRDYSDVFLRYGVGLIGPGDSGPWKNGRRDEEFEGRFVRQFANDIRDGDILLLRAGRSKVRAIGIVTGQYQYLSQFDDVNGWDLQHARRVRWFKLIDDQIFHGNIFGANPSRLSNCTNPNAIDFARRIVNSPPDEWQRAALPDLPGEEEDLKETPCNLGELVALAQDMNNLYWQNEAFGSVPCEDELIAHFVVPMFIRMGWPPERIAVKWENVDVAVFSKLPRTSENCHILVEAKRLGSGVEGALKQVVGYATKLGFARDLIVTDGMRYRLYSGSRPHKPVAYANLLRLKVTAKDFFDRVKYH